MGITKRGDRFRAQGTGLNGKRISGTFNTEAEALAFLLKTRQARAEHKLSQRNNSGNIDLDFEIAATRTGTVASVLEVALKVDWSDSPDMRGRGVRACRMLGFNTPITEVTTETLDDLVASLKQDGISNGTIRTYLAALSVLLKRARRMKAIYELPLMPEGRTVRKRSHAIWWCRTHGSSTFCRAWKLTTGDCWQSSSGIQAVVSARRSC